MSGSKNRTGRATVPAPRSSSPRPVQVPGTIASAGRIAVHLLLFVLGMAVGLAGVMVQPLWLPAGLVLSLAGAVAVFGGGRTLARSRSGAVVPALGWFVMVLAANAQRPEGDFLVAASTGSYVFLLGGLALAGLCATLPFPGVRYPTPTDAR